jgi:hypothetical protein
VVRVKVTEIWIEQMNTAGKIHLEMDPTGEDEVEMIITEEEKITVAIVICETGLTLENDLHQTHETGQCQIQETSHTMFETGWGMHETGHITMISLRSVNVPRCRHQSRFKNRF